MNKKIISKKSSNKKNHEIKAVLSDGEVVSASKEALDLYSNRLFGEYLGKRVRYSLSEATYLLDKKKISVYKKSKKLSLKFSTSFCKFGNADKIQNFELFRFIAISGDSFFNSSKVSPLKSKVKSLSDLKVLDFQANL